MISQFQAVLNHSTITGSRGQEIEATYMYENYIFLSTVKPYNKLCRQLFGQMNRGQIELLARCVDVISYRDARKCQGMKYHLKYYPKLYKRWPLIKFSDFSFFSVVSLALKDVHLVFLQAGQIKNLLKKIFRMVPISFLYVNPFRNDNFVNINYFISNGAS